MLCLYLWRWGPVAGVWVQPPASCTTDSLGFCQQVPGSEFACRYSYLPTSTICRAATGVCDVADSCSGTSPNCPEDIRKPNCPPRCPTANLPMCVDGASGGWLNMTGLSPALRCQLAMIVVHSAGCYKTVRCEYRLGHHKTDSIVSISLPSLWWASVEACLLSLSFHWLQGYGCSHPPTAPQTVAGSARQCQAQSISASTPTKAPGPSAERQLMFVMLLRHAVAPQLAALQT
jgi:hypothetical protein